MEITYFHNKSSILRKLYHKLSIDQIESIEKREIAILDQLNSVIEFS